MPPDGENGDGRSSNGVGVPVHDHSGEVDRLYGLGPTGTVRVIADTVAKGFPTPVALCVPAWHQ